MWFHSNRLLGESSHKRPCTDSDFFASGEALNEPLKDTDGGELTDSSGDNSGSGDGHHFTGGLQWNLPGDSTVNDPNNNILPELPLYGIERSNVVRGDESPDGLADALEKLGL